LNKLADDFSSFRGYSQRGKTERVLLSLVFEAFLLELWASISEGYSDAPATPEELPKSLRH
jgi:hypothetical protein